MRFSPSRLGFESRVPKYAPEFLDVAELIGSALLRVGVGVDSAKLYKVDRTSTGTWHAVLQKINR